MADDITITLTPYEAMQLCRHHHHANEVIRELYKRSGEKIEDDVLKAFAACDKFYNQVISKIAPSQIDDAYAERDVNNLLEEIGDNKK